jgi:hypothetical protein
MRWQFQHHRTRRSALPLTIDILEDRYVPSFFNEFPLPNPRSQPLEGAFLSRHQTDVAQDVRRQEHAVLLTPDESAAPRGVNPGILSALVSSVREPTSSADLTNQSPANGLPVPATPETPVPTPTGAVARQTTDALFASYHRSPMPAHGNDWESNIWMGLEEVPGPLS